MIANDGRGGPPGSLWIECPVAGCPWRLRFDDLVSLWGCSTTDQDRQTSAHLATHSAEELAATVAGLRTGLADATRTMTPDDLDRPPPGFSRAGRSAPARRAAAAAPASGPATAGPAPR